MPIYEYKCGKCGEVTEALQKFSDKPLTKCTHCGGKLGKLMSMNSFQLKGGGWYVTDYANKKADNDPGPHTPAATPAETKTEGKKAKEPKASKANKA